MREPDPEIREEKKQELVEIIKPKPRPSLRRSQEPPGELLTAIQVATAKMPAPQQTRVDRLLQQTGISLKELLKLIE